MINVESLSTSLICSFLPDQEEDKKKEYKNFKKLTIDISK